MSTIVTRSGEGSPLTHAEVDANFTNLNTDKYQEGSAIGTVTPAAGAFTTLSASSTVSGTGFSTYLASPPAIGGTTAAAGTFTTLIGGADVANYGQLTGGATTKAVEFKSLGSDTNVSWAIRSKGTGAIDLAAGSSGVNISNGGTVTALTRTVNGTGYTSFPSIVISAPTTAGGVQATASNTYMQNLAATIQSGGTGYTVGDVLTMVGGTFQSAAGTFTVATVSSGVVTSVTNSSFQNYSVLPSNPVSVTGGTGTGCTLNVTYLISGVFTITNAGSGYVEQPTVTFSGGGGTGAAAYATVGTTPLVTSLANNLRFANAGGLAFQLGSAGTATVNYLSAQGSSAGNAVLLGAAGSDGNISVRVSSLGTSSVSLFTNNSSQEALRATHTASAVNYVQVTGAATGARPTISAQGSDAALGLNFQWKGGANAYFISGNGTQFRMLGGPSSTVNNLYTQGSAAGSAPVIASEGSDTDIDLTLTPKGAGRVKFGTYTANMALTIQGYIEIKDSGGTTRRLAVIA